MRLLFTAALLLGCVFVSCSVADQSQGKASEESPTVGVSRSIRDLILPGSELTTKPIDGQSPIILRIADSRVH